MGCPEPDHFVDLQEGRLDPTLLGELETHLSSCPRCAHLAAELARLEPAGPTEAPWLRAGDRVDRYIVRTWLGKGGMGQLFIADDPQLKRKVALKLPQARVAEKATERVLLEARAMAQLVHPNVVTVHDAGVANGRPFIAMELVVGVNLSEWSREPRPLAEIVATYLAAGRGLAAAHQAGLLHRDFKPSNVLMADDGRVLVTDFGLATGDVVVELDAESSGASPVQPIDELLLSATGELVGTPAYMAPELFHGNSATERSDQFGFAVALFEALTGNRPYVGDTLAELAAAFEAGPSRPTPDVPKPLARTLERALAVNPLQRWSSMDALIAELSSSSSGRRRKLVGAAALALGVVAAGGWALWARASSPDLMVLCGNPSEEVAVVWNEPRRDAISKSFEAIDRPFAAQHGQRVDEALTRYTEGWLAARDEACRASYVDQTASPELFSERRQCLGSHLASFAAFVERVGAVDVGTLEVIAETAYSLAPLSECSRDGVLAFLKPDPAENQRRAVETVRSKLRKFQVSAVMTISPTAANISEAAAIAKEADGLGYQPLVADAYSQLAAAQRLSGDFSSARDSAMRSLSAAQATTYRYAAARASLELALIEAADYSEGDEALERWAKLAHASIEPLSDHLALRANLAHLDAVVAGRRGDLAARLAAFELKLEVERAMYGGDSPRLAKTQINVATTLGELGESQRAIEGLEKAARIIESELGPYHSLATSTRLNLALFLLRVERAEDAIAMTQEQIDIRTQVAGADSASVAFARQNLAAIYQVTGDASSSLIHARAAYEILSKVYGSDHPKVARAAQNLGNSLFGVERFAEAVDMIRVAIAGLKESFGADHPKVALAQLNLSGALAGAGDHRAALDAASQAYSTLADKLSPDHPQAVMARYSVGRELIAVGQVKSGIEALLEARRRNGKLSASSRAMIELDIARALFRHKAGVGAARDHAKAARELVGQDEEFLAEIDEFISELER